MHADSIPISRATPAYPVEEIVKMTNCTMLPRICSVTGTKYKRRKCRSFLIVTRALGDYTSLLSQSKIVKGGILCPAI